MQFPPRVAFTGIFLTLVAMVVMAGLSFAQPLPQDEAPAIPGQLYVHFDDESAAYKTAQQALEDVASYYQITSVEKAFPSLDVIARHRELTPSMDALRHVYRVRYAVQKTPEQVGLGVGALPGVLYAEPVYMSEPEGMPVEPDDEDYRWQSQLPHMRLPEAWDVVKGEEGDVVIAVVDNGTDWRHPDLMDNVWTNVDEVPGDGIDNDQNGHIDDVHGWRFFDGNPDPTAPPDNGDEHGTVVAGIAAAVTDNGLGLAGASWNAKFMPLNVKCEKYSTYCYSYEGILYAAVNGADIINTSFGGQGYSNTNHMIIKAAYAEGSLVVASAGNDRADVDFKPHYPASYPQTLSVGGIRKNSDRNVWNYGQSVNVFAPSERIDAPAPGGRYTRVQGTSFATPLTAGVAALVKTAFPDYTPGQIREQIRLTAVSIDEANPRRRGKMGRGKVDAYRAVTEAPLPGIRVVDWSMRNQDGSSRVGIGDDVTLSVAFENFHGAASSVSVEMLTDESNLDFSVQRVELGSMGLGDRREAEFLFTIRDAVLHGAVRLTPEITAGSLIDRPDILRIEIEPSHAVMRSDSLALAALYHAADGSNWYNNRGWLERPVRDWRGITVTGDRVTGIALYNNDLSGVIPAEFGALTELRILELYKNDLVGAIPKWIGALKNLEHLSLSGNEFTGPIPAWIGDLVHLENLYLSRNQLSGPIPAEIGVLEHLVTLWLHNNELSGTIPSEIGSLKNLEELTLTDNTLSGSIPPEIGMLTNLRKLGLGNNQLSGTIPSEIGLLIKLEEFGAWKNDFTGLIPAEIGNLVNLSSLSLTHNELSGSIPSEIGHLHRLTDLRLYHNELSGTIPSSIGDLTNLEYIDLSDNNLSGPIPFEMSQLYHLTTLSLGRNNLSGSIPSWIGRLVKLEELYLTSSQLSGSIPSWIGNLSNLVSLSLNYNQLSGKIPMEIGQLDRLTYLGLFRNELFGPIPSTIGNLTNLEYLGLSGNEFTGSIPSEIGQLDHLTELHLHSNELSGPIPSEIVRLEYLTELTLSINNLSGPIPSKIGNLINLEELTLRGNQLSGSLPLEMQKLNRLKKFQFDQRHATVNALCAPLDAAFQTWLRTIETMKGPNCAVGTIADSESELPSEFVVHGNYPNPFRNATNILVDLPTDATIVVQVYDMLGRKVIERAPVIRTAGWERTIEIGGERLASGNYFYRLQVDSGDSKMKRGGMMTLVR